MFDNPLISLVFSVFSAGFIAMGYTGPTAIAFAQNFQPTAQGVNTQNTVYLNKLGDHRYGYLERTNVWDQDAQTMIHTETQFYETMFQINALAIQDAANVNSLTASDIVNLAAAILQSDASRATLIAAGVNILRITDVRNPYFMDDKDRFEADPSFDFTLEHEQVIVSTAPFITDIVVNIDRV